ncbi:hypothetical protein [Paenibacillus taihuensis]|nr:hypothetical protein [Paenibacillus taihuensis]
MDDKTDMLIRLIKAFVQEAILPFSESLPVIISYEKKKTEVVGNSPFNEKGLDKLYKLLKKGDIIDVSIRENLTFDYWDAAPQYYIPRIGLGLHWWGDTRPASDPVWRINKYMNTFSFALSERVFGPVVPQDIQRLFIQLFRMVVSELNAVTGQISFDSTRADSAVSRTHFEGYHGIDPEKQPGYTERLHGYHWMNLLTSGHIAKLGGVDYVLQEAPAYRKEILEINGESAILLQLTEDINDYSDDALRTLRTFFLPLLHWDSVSGEGASFYAQNPTITARLVED